MNDLVSDLEKILGTLAKLFATDGNVREVSVLAMSKATIVQTHQESWNGGVYGYTIYLEVPEGLYHQLGGDIYKIQGALKNRSKDITRLYANEWIEAFTIVAELTEDKDWKEKAKDFVTGKGVTNQGRARSDNIAPRMCDGLLFRSQPEIHLYRAFKAIGVTFAPLPVFIRGGETYRRIEPDFVIFKDGVFLVVEVDGDTVHHESPLDAHNRTTMLAHEGAHIERVNANECDTPEKARQCAARMMAVLAKLKANK